MYSYTCIYLGIGTENTEENRRKYRQLLFKTKGNDFRSPDCFSNSHVAFYFSDHFYHIYMYIYLSIQKQVYDCLHIYVLKESDANTANYV
jgi:hypothetical protein